MDKNRESRRNFLKKITKTTILLWVAWAGTNKIFELLKTHCREQYKHKQKVIFADHIAIHEQIRKYDRKSSFWKRIRDLRYYQENCEALEYAPDITFESFRALWIVEWEGDPLSINKKDGWAGKFHIQPDVATKEFDMKIFTNNSKYKQYDFDKLKKQGKNKAEIYKIHGKLLQKIIKENNNLETLAALDDRFHPTKCLKKVAERLQKDYIFAKKILEDNMTWAKEIHFKAHVKNLWWDLYQYAAMNGYNKWTGSFYKTTNQHLENITYYIKKCHKFDTILEQGIAKLLSNEALRDYIIQETNAQIK